MPAIQVAALYRYPVKGFSPESLDRVEIAAGGTFPFDRAFAIENGPSGFDPAAPAYFPKAYFLMLMKNERMAEFQTRFDDASGVFRIFRDAVLQVEGSLRAAGRPRSDRAMARRKLPRRTAGAAKNPLSRRPFLLRHAGEGGACRQSRERARARREARASARSAALSAEYSDRWPSGARRAGVADEGDQAAGRRRFASRSERAAAPRRTSIRRPAHATCRFRTRSTNSTGTQISGSIWRRRPADRSRSGMR